MPRARRDRPGLLVLVARRGDRVVDRSQVGTINHTIMDRDGQLQVAPLRVNDDGAAALPVCVAWNPIVVEAPGASVPL
jgi:hypothetical protein